MTDQPLTFTLSVDHNPYLLVGKRTFDTIIQVKAAEAGPDAADGPPLAAEVVIIDTSRSMTGSRIEEARRAAAAAVDAARDGTFFAVIAGHTIADLVYPPKPAMAVATARNRAAAKRAIAKVAAGGTTNMSTWLRLADTLLTGCPARIKHAIMLTDGHSTDDDGALPAGLKACEGHFVCDCRGVGDGWREDELRQVARALLGTWAPVAAPELLADDFRAALEASMAKRIPGVLLRIKLFGKAKVTYFAQVMPVIEEVTGKGVIADGGQAVEFPLGHWGADRRDYHLRLETSRDLDVKAGEEARPARLEVVLPAPGPGGGDVRVAASAPVIVSWTTDTALSSTNHPKVDVYNDQEELAAAVNEGLNAWRDGRPGAGRLIGRAVQLAFRDRKRYADLLERFSAIAEFVDPAAGVVRLRGYDQVSRADLIWTSYLSEQSRLVDSDEPDDDG